jgi:hypothetical protein
VEQWKSRAVEKGRKGEKAIVVEAATAVYCSTILLLLRATAILSLIG